MLMHSATGQKFINMDDEFGIGYVEIAFQDSYGLMWIASRNGLFSFDGYSVTQYTNDPAIPNSLPSNSVISVGEGKSGNIWVCLGSSGLATLDRDSGVFRAVCPTGHGYDCDSDPTYLMTLQDTSGALWVATSNGLLLMKENGEIIHWYKYSVDDEHSLFKNYVIGPVHGQPPAVVGRHLLRDKHPRSSQRNFL